ncbi:MAG: nucleotidyltransferase domain-containing protein [Candidatus Caenarcaniphilales bacterium]|jgi:predicted nucleotidyltransferase|nr:nucleotidyltransferase domain-containing protein [Candidatus Caenarcaniphilales bacterium]
MVKKFNRSELELIINHYLNSLKDQMTINKAILFGSYAKGTATELSDIDLFIISEDLPKNKLKGSNGYFLDQLVGDVNPSLEVIAIHPDDLSSDEVSRGLYEEIFKTGIQLV